MFAHLVVVQIRTNNVTLAVHILQGAHQLCPDDPITLNELGVAALTLGNISEALHYFEQAVRIVSQFEGNYKYIDSEEIFCNYGTCLRRASRLEDALLIYQRCLSMNPRSTENHANVGFTLHLLKRFSDAIEYYHTVLGFEPAHAFCSEMLNNAIEDSLSLSGANDRGPVSLLFGSSLAADSRSGNNDAVSGDDMVLSPLLNKGSDNTVGIFGMDDRSSIMPVDSPVLHTKRFANDSEIVSSVQSESRVRFDTSGAEMSGRRTEQGRNFNLFNHSGQPETPYSDSGSVCPFPGFGMPSTGATAKIRNDVSLGHAATPDFSDRGTAARIGEIGTAGSVDYSPYSYINAVGGARRVSFNTSNPAGSAAPTAHMGGIELSGIYSEGTEESRTEFELCGDVADSFHSSPSVMSFSRVTGNMSWSADGDTTPRDEDA